ncbi:MAG: hypothetical protein LBM70_01210 [Victivallales bacterium]|jgi:hypothetical protein|nr:hypothetical protein [Victivallales bacterium]
MVSKKGKIVLFFILAALLVVVGSLCKLNHLVSANWILGAGVIIFLAFLYLLIAYFIQSQEIKKIA